MFSFTKKAHSLAIGRSGFGICLRSRARAAVLMCLLWAGPGLVHAQEPNLTGLLDILAAHPEGE